MYVVGDVNAGSVTLTVTDVCGNSISLSATNCVGAPDISTPHCGQYLEPGAIFRQGGKCYVCTSLKGRYDLTWTKYAPCGIGNEWWDERGQFYVTGISSDGIYHAGYYLMYNTVPAG